MRNPFQSAVRGSKLGDKGNHTADSGITPPPKSSHSSHPGEPAPGDTAGPSRRDVGPWLKNLMRAESVKDEQAQQALQAMRQLEKQMGGYLLGSDIKNYLDRLPLYDSRRKEYNKDRGYGLAAELFIHEAYRQIEGIEAQNHALGPTVFAEYCTDIIDSFFARTNVRKGIEAPIALAEHLLHKAVESPLHRQQFLTLAQTAIKTTVDNAAIRHEKDILTTRAGIRRDRSVETLFPTKPEDAEVQLPIDKAVMAYLHDFQRKVSDIQKVLDKFVEQVSLSTTADESPETNLQACDELQRLLRLVHGIEHHPFTGLLKERLGALRQRAQTDDSGADLLRTAAAHYELQGDREKALELTTLCAERYKRAARLYEAVSDTAGAQRIALKRQAGGSARKSA